MKQCTKCKLDKNMNEFHKTSKLKSGLKSQCKSCASSYKTTNRESIKLSNAQYYSNHKAKHKESTAKYRSENYEEIQVQRSAYRKSPEGKSAISKILKKSNDKYPNAMKSRAYYAWNKNKIKVLSYCQRCSSTNKIEAHHHDYNLPLDVEFLCRPCHVDEHNKNTPINRVSGLFTKEKAS